MNQEGHSAEPPAYIKFGEYSTHVPANIPSAVQQATDRFLTTRAARLAEMPQWEDLRQAGHEIRLHTLLYLDSYLEMLAQKVEEAGGHVHWAQDAAQAR